MLRNDAIIIAHYHKHGLLRLDTIDLIGKASTTFKKVVLVSTNISRDQLQRIPDTVEVIIRENCGYDFLSYRIGFLSVLPNNYDNIYMLNTSVVVVDLGKFEKNVLSVVSGENSSFGSTKCFQIREHIQSYFYGFPNSVFNRDNFKSWWLNLTPLEHKGSIIHTYEVGLSTFLLSTNVSLHSVYQSTDIRDLTQFDWVEVFNHTGVIKTSLIKTNFHNVDISYLYELSKDYKIQSMLRQVLED